MQPDPHDLETVGEPAPLTGVHRWWLPVLAMLAASALLMLTYTSPTLTKVGIMLLTMVGLLLLLGFGPTWPHVAVPLLMLSMLLTVPVNQLADNGIWKVAAGCLGLLGGLLLIRSMPPPAGSWLLLALLLQLNVLTLLVLGPDGVSMVILLGVIPLVAFVAGGQLTPRTIGIVRSAVITFAFAEAVLAIAEVVFGVGPLWAPARVDETGAANPLRNELIGGDLVRAQGTFGHPLPLGLLLLLGVVFTTRLRRPWLRLLLTATMLAGLAAAGTRLSLVLALICVIVLGPRREVQVLAALYKLALFGLAFLVATRNLDFSALFTQVSGTGSLTHRLEALRSVERLLLWQDLPSVIFGHGFGSTAEAFSNGLLQSDGLATVDNQYVLILYQGGLLGLCLFVAFLARIVARAARSGTGMMPAVLVVIVTMWAYDVVTWPSSVALVMMVFGMAVSDRRDDRSAATQEAPVWLGGLTYTAGGSVRRR